MGLLGTSYAGVAGIVVGTGFVVTGYTNPHLSDAWRPLFRVGGLVLIAASAGLLVNRVVD